MTPDPSEAQAPEGRRVASGERYPVLLAADGAIPLALDATRVRRVADQPGDDARAELLDVSEALGLPAPSAAVGSCELLAEIAGGSRRVRLPGRVVVRHVELTDFRSVPAFLGRYAARLGVQAFFLTGERVGLLVDVGAVGAPAGPGGAP